MAAIVLSLAPVCAGGKPGKGRESRETMREEILRRGAVRRARDGLGRAAAAILAITIAAPLAGAFTAHPGAAQEGPDGEAHRKRALELVNISRAENGLPPLTIGRAATDAAKAHAADMLRRNYYGHNSPEGKTVGDRFLKAGGGKWLVAAENIARCEACKPPVTPETLAELQEGWMNSPGHRKNILQRGVSHFGYSILIDDKRGLYAVQVFSGPGMPSGLGPNEVAKRASDPELAAQALDILNRERKQARLPALAASPALTKAAKSLIPERRIEDFDLGESGKILDALSEDDRRDWQSVTVLAGSCGGCGGEPTGADVRAFTREWLNDARNKSLILNPAVTHLGFTLAASGQGRKVTLAVLGKARGD
jgi:uncharacterized protein YkwD